MLQKKRPNLYWTPCAAHCIDLILEDIGKLPNIKRTLERAISLNGYIYNRSGLLNMMRHFTGQKELLRPAKTRFATAFITLSRLHEQKNNLRKMFTSAEWSESKWAKEQKGKDVAKTVIIRGANETIQLPSYSNLTRSKLGQNSTRMSSTRNVNESSRATRNSTRKAREKLENILYIKF